MVTMLLPAAKLLHKHNAVPRIGIFDAAVQPGELKQFLQ
jgi:hypothetical protein